MPGEDGLRELRIYPVQVEPHFVVDSVEPRENPYYEMDRICGGYVGEVRVNVIVPGPITVEVGDDLAYETIRTTIHRSVRAFVVNGVRHLYVFDAPD